MQQWQYRYKNSTAFDGLLFAEALVTSQGTTRIGSTPADSVVDQHCKVHGIDNLYLAGNGVIPSAIACNPTLTTVAFAVIGSNNIISLL